MKKLLWASIFSLIAFGQTLQAEIEEIMIRWNAATCLETCIPLLRKSLAAITSVNNLQMNGRSGTAVMGWSPNQPFSYEPFRLASSAAGVRILDMRLRVRGTIAHDIDNFYLVSIGDNARFLLIGPIQANGANYVPYYNLLTHPLTGPVIAKLLEAERNQQTVSISGPLFLPTHYPRTLIAEQIKFNK
jgi:hypothetical protein